MTDATTDPYFAEAVHFAEANWTSYGLEIGKVPNPVKVARLQVSTLNHLRAFKRTGPPTTATHLLGAARYGVAVAERDFSPNKIDTQAGSYVGAVGDTISGAKDALAPLHGIAAIGELAVKVTELMSGQKHILLRTVYVLFGGIFLLAGIAILARELGMKTVSDQVNKTLGPVKVNTNSPKGFKVGKTTVKVKK
jgi:hypothetical protein